MVYQNDRYGAIVAALEQKAEFATFQIRDNSHYASYYFVKRDLSTVFSALEGGKYFDIITPFDYGGCFFTCKEIIPHFFEAFSQYCQEENIISEFIRFCPTYTFDFETIAQYIDLQKVNDLVYMDLCEDFWNGYSRGRKSDIAQAQKKCYCFEKINIHNFYTLYKETMVRNEAHSYFYFDQAVLQKLVDEKFARVFGIRVNGELVSSLIVLDEKETSYYFLSATANAFLSFRFNALLIHEVALMLQKEGQKKFFLGGGRAGVYDFKRRFSHKTLPYFIGKKIHNQSIYNDLVTLTKRQDNAFFPQYREKII